LAGQGGGGAGGWRGRGVAGQGGWRAGALVGCVWSAGLNAVSC
jgi:hypothetical protein